MDSAAWLEMIMIALMGFASGWLLDRNRRLSSRLLELRWAHDNLVVRVGAIERAASSRARFRHRGKDGRLVDICAQCPLAAEANHG